MPGKAILRLGLFVMIAILFWTCDHHEGNSNTVSENDSHYVRENDQTGCGIEDGDHDASVDYNNPDTDYNAHYTLAVEVQNCQVVKIKFPNGGWLDESHISPEDLDNEGNASIEDDRGRTY